MKILNNYSCQLSVLFAFTWCMNFTTKIVYCALILTCLTAILNGIAKCHGNKKATISIILCTTVTLGLLYNKQYCIIAGKPIGGLITASLSAILIASYIGCKLFLKLETRYSFAASNFISSLTAGLVDHLIMGIFFTSKFPMHKVVLMCYKETAYTTLFACVVYLCSAAVLYAKQVYDSMNNPHTGKSLLGKCNIKHRSYKQL